MACGSGSCTATWRWVEGDGRGGHGWLAGWLAGWLDDLHAGSIAPFPNALLREVIPGLVA